MVRACPFLCVFLKRKFTSLLEYTRSPFTFSTTHLTISYYTCHDSDRLATADMLIKQFQSRSFVRSEAPSCYQLRFPYLHVLLVCKESYYRRKDLDTRGTLHRLQRMSSSAELCFFVCRGDKYIISFSCFFRSIFPLLRA